MIPSTKNVYYLHNRAYKILQVLVLKRWRMDGLFTRSYSIHLVSSNKRRQAPNLIPWNCNKNTTAKLLIALCWPANVQIRSRYTWGVTLITTTMRDQSDEFLLVITFQTVIPKPPHSMARTGGVATTIQVAISTERGITTSTPDNPQCIVPEQEKD